MVCTTMTLAVQMNMLNSYQAALLLQFFQPTSEFEDELPSFWARTGTGRIAEVYISACMVSGICIDLQMPIAISARLGTQTQAFLSPESTTPIEFNCEALGGNEPWILCLERASMERLVTAKTDSDVSLEWCNLQVVTKFLKILKRGTAIWLMIKPRLPDMQVCSQLCRFSPCPLCFSITTGPRTWT